MRSREQSETADIAGALGEGTSAKTSCNDCGIIFGGVDWCAWVGGMKQLTLATAGFDRYAKTTRRAAFLAEMEGVAPWPALCGLIEPFYPKPGNGRPSIGI